MYCYIITKNMRGFNNMTTIGVLKQATQNFIKAPNDERLDT